MLSRAMRPFCLTVVHELTVSRSSKGKQKERNAVGVRSDPAMRRTLPRTMSCRGAMTPLTSTARARYGLSCSDTLASKEFGNPGCFSEAMQGTSHEGHRIIDSDG